MDFLSALNDWLSQIERKCKTGQTYFSACISQYGYSSLNCIQIFTESTIFPEGHFFSFCGERVGGKGVALDPQLLW